MADEAEAGNLMTLLRRHRIALGMSQTDLARKMKVAPSAVSMWKSGVSLPKPSRVPLLARVLGVPAMQLTRLVAPEDERPIALT